MLRAVAADIDMSPALSAGSELIDWRHLLSFDFNFLLTTGDLFISDSSLGLLGGLLVLDIRSIVMILNYSTLSQVPQIFLVHEMK